MILLKCSGPAGNIGGVGGALYGGVGNLVVVMGLLLEDCIRLINEYHFASTDNIAGAGKAFGGWAGRKGLELLAGVCWSKPKTKDGRIKVG